MFFQLNQEREVPAEERVEIRAFDLVDAENDVTQKRGNFLAGRNANPRYTTRYRLLQRNAMFNVVFGGLSRCAWI
jgi:hypothetical protein